MLVSSRFHLWGLAADWVCWSLGCVDCNWITVPATIRRLRPVDQSHPDAEAERVDPPAAQFLMAAEGLLRTDRLDFLLLP